MYHVPWQITSSGRSVVCMAGIQFAISALYYDGLVCSLCFFQQWEDVLSPFLQPVTYIGTGVRYYIRCGA